MKTVSDTGRGFVEFLELTLFLIIRLIPYVILIAVLIIVILLLTKNAYPVRHGFIRLPPRRAACRQCRMHRRLRSCSLCSSRRMPGLHRRITICRLHQAYNPRMHRQFRLPKTRRTPTEHRMPLRALSRMTAQMCPRMSRLRKQTSFRSSAPA